MIVLISVSFYNVKAHTMLVFQSISNRIIVNAWLKYLKVIEFEIEF